MARRDFQIRWSLLKHFLRVVQSAPGSEAATGFKFGEAGDHPLDRNEFGFRNTIEARDGRKKPPSICMLWVGKKLAGAGSLDNSSGIHHANLVTGFRYDSKIMSDQKN